MVNPLGAVKCIVRFLDSCFRCGLLIEPPSRPSELSYAFALRKTLSCASRGRACGLPPACSLPLPHHLHPQFARSRNRLHSLHRAIPFSFEILEMLRGNRPAATNAIM